MVCKLGEMTWEEVSRIHQVTIRFVEGGEGCPWLRHAVPPENYDDNPNYTICDLASETWHTSWGSVVMSKPCPHGIVAVWKTRMSTKPMAAHAVLAKLKMDALDT